MDLLACVSGHGFGHAARMAALLAELRERAGPGLRLGVRTHAPAWLFAEVSGLAVSRPVCDDPGTRQRDPLTIDLAATAAAQREWIDRFDANVEREAGFLRERAVRLVLADAPSLACAAAAHAGIPAWVLTNFTWDWILSGLAAAEPALRAAAAAHRRAYAHATGALRLPLHGDFSAFSRVVDVPHLVRRATRDPADVRRALGLAGDSRPLVLVSFGGLGTIDVPAAASVRDFAFAGFGPAPAGLEAAWRTIEVPSPIAHPDLVAAADVVLGKTGYGTVSEALAHGTRFVYVPRPDWPEAVPLEAGLHAARGAIALSRGDFRAGRWGTALERALSLAPPAAVRADGARRIAEHVLDGLLGG